MAQGEPLRRKEPGGAAVQLDRQVLREVTLVGRRDVDPSVAIEIGGHDPIWKVRGADDLARLERAVPQAEVYSDLAFRRPLVADDDVEVSIVVQIRKRHALRQRTGRDRRHRRESPISGPDEQRQRALVVRDHQIEVPVAVDVARGRVFRGGPNRIAHLRLERSVGTPEEDGHVVRTQVHNDQVGPAIVIEVSADETEWSGP